MRNRVRVRMTDGHELVVAGRASDVAKTVNEARGQGRLIQLERDVIPAGQVLHIDPDEVALVRDDR